MIHLYEFKQGNEKITDFVKGNKLSGIDLYQLAIMQLELLKKKRIRIILLMYHVKRNSII
ncbi:hypothetical protein ACFQDF_16625 [Ectobacillus funiculus]